jgi:hypothetical protein
VRAADPGGSGGPGAGFRGDRHLGRLVQRRRRGGVRKAEYRPMTDRSFSMPSTLFALDGEDWRRLPLESLMARLEKLLATASPGIQFSHFFEGDGATAA